MHSSPIILTLAFLTLVSAEARLNETRLDLTQRFRQPRSEKHNQLHGSTECVFHQDDWIIRAYLINGHCEHISYTKSGVAFITAEQVDALMESNAAGMTWKKNPAGVNVGTLIVPNYVPHLFTRSDGLAFCEKTSHGVAFSSAKWKELENTKKAERAASKAAIPQF